MSFITKNIRLIAIFVFVAVLIATFFFAYGGNKHKQTVFVFDTVADIILYGKNAEFAADEISFVLPYLENTYSKHKSSDVSVFNSLSSGQTMTVSDEMAKLIERCLDFSKATDGAFDITTSALSDLWDVKNSTTPPRETEILSALEKTGYDKLLLDKNTLTKTDVSMDFGGVLKGFAADKVREIAKNCGVKSGIVNLGGNVCLIGSKKGKPWTVGIVNPFSPGEVYLTIDAQDTNIITSGAYQRYFEYDGQIYHHILSPKTGYPAESDIASATVISKDGTLADALSTAIFVLGSKKGIDIATEFGVDVVLIKKDGSVIATDKVNYKLNGPS